MAQQLITFAAGAPVVDAAVYKLVAKARRRIAVVGIGRSGKSSLLNMVSSTLARKHCAPFRAARGAAHVTHGVQVAVVGDVALIDCQGVALGDGSLDKPLLLAAHYLADVVVYNQRGVLDSTIFANLTQMAAFVALAEGGRSAPPLLVVRLRDSDDDFGGDAGAARAAALVAGFLDPAIADQHRTMRSAFAKLFAGVRLVATDEISRKDADPMEADYAAFMRGQPSFAAAAARVLALANEAAAAPLGSHGDFRELLADQCGISLRDLDVLNTGVELAMRRFVDGLRGLPPPAAEYAALEERRVLAVKTLADFDKQFCRVADSSLAAQRAALRELLVAPLYAARVAYCEAQARSLGAVDKPPAWWTGPTVAGLAEYVKIIPDLSTSGWLLPDSKNSLSSVHSLLYGKMAGMKGSRETQPWVTSTLSASVREVQKILVSLAATIQSRKNDFHREYLDLIRAQYATLTPRPDHSNTAFAFSDIPGRLGDHDARVAAFADQVRLALALCPIASALEYHATPHADNSLDQCFVRIYYNVRFISTGGNPEGLAKCLDPGMTDDIIQAEAMKSRRTAVADMLVYGDSSVDHLNRLYGEPTALASGVSGAKEPNRWVGLSIDSGFWYHSVYNNISCPRNHKMIAVRRGSAHCAFAEALAKCFGVPLSDALEMAGPADIPEHERRINHASRYFRFLDEIDAIPMVRAR